MIGLKVLGTVTSKYDNTEDSGVSYRQEGVEEIRTVWIFLFCQSIYVSFFFSGDRFTFSTDAIQWYLLK